RFHTETRLPLNKGVVPDGTTDLLCNAVNDGLRCSRGRHETIPCACPKSREAGFGDGRHIGQLWRTPLTRYRKEADAAAARVRKRISQYREHHRHMSCDHVVKCRSISLIAHIAHFQPGTFEEHRHR